MAPQDQINYQRIAEAIAYIRRHFKTQPELDAVAEHVHLSPYHFQRLFTEWAGVSPKKFLQYTSIAHAKALLQQQYSLSETAEETGLSGTGRLHDLFINIEGMTPGEYKNGGSSLSLSYNFYDTPFGNILIAATDKGICHMMFADDTQQALAGLKSSFPNARYIHTATALHLQALSVFGKSKADGRISLHLKGTAFQLKVWESLLKIPMGSLSTYSSIADALHNPKASRAVGSAIGSNPVAYLIPCHRVIRGDGSLGGYMWGLERKTAMIGWESAKTIKQLPDAFAV